MSSDVPITIDLENPEQSRENIDVESKPANEDKSSLSPFSFYENNKTEKNVVSERSVPQDEPEISKLTEAFFMLIGTNVLFAYNTFINGLDFFDQLFPGKDVPTNITRAYNIAASLAYFVSLPFIERFTLSQRFYFSSIGISVVMIFTFIYSNIKPIYEVVLGASIFCALFSGVLFGTSMGYAGLFGVNCSSMATTGLALGGLITSIVRILSKFMKGGEGWFYFGVCVVFNVGACISFTFFQRTDLAKEKCANSHVSTDFCERMTRVKDVIGKVYPYFLEAFLCMAITLTLFPGYACKIPSKHGLSDSWVTTIVTSSYMVGDFFGRLGTRWFSFPSAKNLWIPHVCRLIFFPIYILAIKGIVGSDDIWIYFVSLFLALSGGYWLALCITYTAKEETLNEDEVELGVFLTTLALNIGIFVGSWLTYAMQ